VIDERSRFGYHVLQQSAQFRNIPLTIAQLVDRMADGLVTIHLERLEKGAACGQYAEVRIQYEKRIRNCIDYTLGLNMAGTQETIQVFHVHQGLHENRR